ncbi:MAG TPA: YraN family protein [Gammaproteobacteria bacterium]|uniref:YraN family protein n=1 Tax=Immundisolibacter sp. TaxID=1934948 RepID=UPI000E7DCA07|nr:YraN family protein [Gammaproteobacteria bacterium]HCZ49748.1 YraN family protein [Gammaproteobacteria bacterium]MCH79186.1 YraN family protein [Gammaproteobacteria bacterium]
MTAAAPHLQRGRDAEALAAAHLTKQGLAIVARNYRAAGGEIDLIARHGAELVFVEVRSRRSGAFGSAAESVTAAKRRRILKAAEQYLLAWRPRPLPPCRFDVISFTGALDLEHLVWLQNAFTAD